MYSKPSIIASSLIWAAFIALGTFRVSMAEGMMVAPTAAPAVQAPLALPMSTSLAPTGISSAKAQAAEAAGVELGANGASVEPSALLKAKQAADKNGGKSNDKTSEAASESSDKGMLQPLGEGQFQQFVRQTTGQALPLFGYDLFSSEADFSPMSDIPVTPDYAVGPGDELIIRVWGALDIEVRRVVDRTGQISLPKVGTFSVMGIKAAELDGYIHSKISRVFRNFEVNVTLGQLRSIQIYVVGHARRPGTYTVSSLSTLIHGLFASGGPSVNGSMRHVQLKRSGKKAVELDLYNFITKGDNEADVRLLAGDVIVIPPVGPRVALAGASSRPAIYELTDKNSSLMDLVKVSSGRLAVTTSTLKAGVERIDPTRNPSRTVEQIALNDKGLATQLKDGDIVTLYPISARIENMLVLERSGAPFMRLPWQPGMRLRDFLLRDQLLTDAYWERVNKANNIGGSQQYEINWDYGTVQRLDEAKLKTEVFAFALDRALSGEPKDNLELRPGDIVNLFDPNQETPPAQDSVELAGSVVGGTQRFPWRANMTIKDLVRDEQWLIDRYNYWQRFSGKDVKGSINWDYATVVRRNESNLMKEIKVFNLRDALRDEKNKNNLVLEPGDIVNLFSNTEMVVPQAKQTRLVTVEGEVNAAGVYQLRPGETLRQLLERAGGLTQQAYVFGTEFVREQTRRQQQERLDQAVRRLEADLSASITKDMANLSEGDQGALQMQQMQKNEQLNKLRALKSNGRIALELSPNGQRIADFPDIALEDGDRIRVPALSPYVMAVGAVNNDNALIWKPGRSVKQVIKLAGPTDLADLDEAFVLRADGTVKSRTQDSSWLFSIYSGFDNMDLMPGDTIVIPEKLDRRSVWTTFMAGLKDWTQILYQLGLGAAAWKTLN